MERSRRARRPFVLVGVVLAATSWTILPASSVAAPRRDLDQVRSQVRDLEMQAAAANERALQAEQGLAEVRDRLAAIDRRRQREQDQLDQRVATLGDLARSMYTGGGLDPTLEVLLADDPVEFLNQAAIVDQVARGQAAQLRGVQTARLRLAQTAAEVMDRQDAARQREQEMDAALAESRDRLAAAQAVLDSLEEKERQRLEAIARQEREDERAAAAAAAASSASASTASASTGGGAAPSSSGSASTSSGGGFTGGSRAMVAVQYALQQVGEPYSFSARPPDSWDCSKLTSAAWAQAGVGITPLSYTQWSQTRRVPNSEIQPGDLVFYFGKGAHHVAIYVGNGKMVSASNPSDGVELIDYLGPWYGERFSGVGRVVG